MLINYVHIGFMYISQATNLVSKDNITNNMLILENEEVKQINK